MKNDSALYIVATPIGNQEDITARALRILNEVDLIAAEDTRHSRQLLQHFGINTRLMSVHQHNEKRAGEKIIAELQKGKSVALISDAGTPLISDPGYHLINAAIAADIQVVPIPGPCAAIAALSAAGLATDQFLFVGFLPAKAGQRQQKLAQLKTLPFTLIFYEAPHRVAALLDDLVNELGATREAVIARELTKKFEVIQHEKMAVLRNYYSEHPDKLRGEFVILIEGAKEEKNPEQTEAMRILKILLTELPIKQAVKLTSQITATPRNLLYQSALNLQK